MTYTTSLNNIHDENTQFRSIRKQNTTHLQLTANFSIVLLAGIQVKNILGFLNHETFNQNGVFPLLQ